MITPVNSCGEQPPLESGQLPGIKLKTHDSIELSNFCAYEHKCYYSPAVGTIGVAPKGRCYQRKVARYRANESGTKSRI